MFLLLLGLIDVLDQGNLATLGSCAITTEWLECFSRALHEALLESDHRPLLLLLDPGSSTSIGNYFALSRNG